MRLRRALDPERGFYWLEAVEQEAIDRIDINQIAQYVSVKQTIPAFLRAQDSDTTHFIMIDEFSVQFKPDVSLAEINAFNEQHGVEIAPFESEVDERQADYNEYLLRVTPASDLNALEAANVYYESQMTVWSVPNFFVNYRFHDAPWPGIE